MANEWRIEADDEWLASHSSDTFQRLRRRARLLGRVSDAVSNAELGPFSGAPRNPQLKVGGRAYSVVRYVGNGERRSIAAVRLCRSCEAGAWLFYSRMPTTARARRIARKVVL